MYTLADAVASCTTLMLGGHCDWRLPSLIELVSILDYSIASPGPTIDRTAFPATPAAVFWSSTPSGGVSTLTWVAYFDSGFTTGDFPTNANHARCVRSAGATTPAGRYTTGGGTVFDTETKLTWQQTAPTTAYTWSEAKTYCASAAVSSALGGSGWRLPTIKELLTIVDYSLGSAPFVDPNAFPAAPARGFWSSSPVAGSPSMAWIVNFVNPSTGSYTTLLTDSARCVR
jgi:Protein of unknown function (DUF1566)